MTFFCFQERKVQKPSSKMNVSLTSDSKPMANKFRILATRTKSSEMIIRKANENDSASIVAFQLAMAWETESLQLDEPTVIKGVAAVFADESKGTYYVAETAGKVVGSLLTTFEWSDWRNGTVLWIQSVYVRPEYRKQSIFSKLYKHVQEKVAADQNLRGIRLYADKTNTSAHQVYEHLGMTAEHYQMYEWMK